MENIEIINQPRIEDMGIEDLGAELDRIVGKLSRLDQDISNAALAHEGDTSDENFEKLEDLLGEEDLLQQQKREVILMRAKHVHQQRTL